MLSVIILRVNMLRVVAPLLLLPNTFQIGQTPLTGFYFEKNLTISLETKVLKDTA
jgi:hypothetical protein